MYIINECLKSPYEDVHSTVIQIYFPVVFQVITEVIPIEVSGYYLDIYFMVSHDKVGACFLLTTVPEFCCIAENEIIAFYDKLKEFYDEI